MAMLYMMYWKMSIERRKKSEKASRQSVGNGKE